MLVPWEAVDIPVCVTDAPRFGLPNGVPLSAPQPATVIARSKDASKILRQKISHRTKGKAVRRIYLALLFVALTWADYTEHARNSGSAKICREIAEKVGGAVQKDSHDDQAGTPCPLF